MSVLLEKRSNGVAVVTLNRPQVLNALDVPAKERLGSIWQDIADDPDVRVAILTGAGEKAFCAGSDIKEINRTGRMVTTETLLHAIPGVGVPLVKPVIAALHGYCIGMGMTLALHCDLRLAANNAVLGYPEVRHGMISAMGPRQFCRGRCRGRGRSVGRHDRRLLAGGGAGHQAPGNVLATHVGRGARRNRSRASVG
jgi:enoyl-CoA hydratase/carnithine racemase